MRTIHTLTAPIAVPVGTSAALADCWEEIARLLAANGTQNDSFGFSIANDDDTVVIGAPNAQPAGSAYVFENIGGSWMQTAKLVPSDIASGFFGSSVDADGQTAIVGAPGDIRASHTGFVYVFTQTGSIWSEQARLSAADGTPGSLYGFSVAAQGDSVLVGAPEYDGVEADSGAVFVLEPTSVCQADVNQDCTLDIFDFLAFQSLFEDGDMRADFDGDGSLTLFDFIAFQNAFAAGCP
ncbi:MAG: hypothetical protein KatS3mg103_0440 [Phycisphaerales bacterium]|nr:MAG: hypothetical protein KatS3mg103_0440 [Phycisphaerales bacterium]